MKTKFNTILMLLALNCVCGSASYAQAPVANSDNFAISQISCSPLQYDVFSNDILYSPVSSNTIDLDPSQPGIQQYMPAQFGGIFQVSGQFVSFQSGLIGLPTPPQTVSYVIVDALGNTSNIATITFDGNSIPIFTVGTNANCDTPANGQITIFNLFMIFDPAILTIREGGNIIAEYNIPPFTDQYVVPGLPPGNYLLDLRLACGLNIILSGNNVELDINNPITGSAVSTYHDYNNDGIVNVGDTVSYAFTVTNSSTTCTMDGVEIYGLENFGTSINSGTIASLAPGATDTSSLDYYRTITQDNINAGSIYLGHAISVSNPDFSLSAAINTSTFLDTSDGIKLNAFIDSNNNGIKDGSEQNYTQGNFSYQINSGEVHTINTYNGEYYLYETNPANVYTLQYHIDTNNNFCGSQNTVATSSYTNITVANDSGVTTYNFAITAVPCNDVSVALYSDRSPRPGFVYTNYITYSNEGNQTNSGTITFTKDSAMILLSNSAGATMDAGGFTYNYSNLLPGQSASIIVMMQVPVIPTVNLGQWLTNSVTITPTDDNAQNNTSTLTRTIIGSFDPNEKTESHGGKIVHSGFTADDYFTYTIRFENTGTAEAINIRVDDLLDANLDETSVKMVKASHPYVLDRVGNALSWRFDGINLPPSVAGNDVQGHGFIVFQVKPKPGFALGDIIPNTANIYFDFNPAIVTNTWTTEFVPFLGVNVFDTGAFEYYPNPTADIVTFSLKNTIINSIEITDVLGKTLISKTIHNATANIDLSSLEKGIYLAKVAANGQEKTVKVMKK